MISWLFAMSLAGEPADVRTSLGGDAWVNWSEMRVEVVVRQVDERKASDNRPLEQEAIDTIEARIGAACEDVPVRGRRSLGQLVPGVSTSAGALWQITEGRYFRDGHVEVVGAVDLLPLVASWSRERAEPPPPVAKGGATGLVLDARGLSVSPSFAPSIRDAGGAVVYDSVLWSDEAFTEAPVIWVSDPASERAGRAGDEPLFARVVAVDGPVLTLSAADGARIRAATDGRRTLGSGTVVVVVDP